MIAALRLFLASLGHASDTVGRVALRGSLALAVAVCVAFPAHAAGADAVSPNVRTFYCATCPLDPSDVTDLRSVTP